MEIFELKIFFFWSSPCLFDPHWNKFLVPSCPSRIQINKLLVPLPNLYLTPSHDILAPGLRWLETRWESRCGLLCRIPKQRKTSVFTHWNLQYWVPGRSLRYFRSGKKPAFGKNAQSNYCCAG